MSLYTATKIRFDEHSTRTEYRITDSDGETIGQVVTFINGYTLFTVSGRSGRIVRGEIRDAMNIISGRVLTTTRDVRDLKKTMKGVLAAVRAAA